MDAPVDATPIEQARPLENDEGIEQVEVVGERPGPEEASFAVTVIPVDGTLAPSADVATAVQRAPGVHIQRLGGLGDWSSVSIRGGTARQVEVFLDGLPLNPEGGASTNLSDLPLWAFERVEVYRGLAPLALDSTAMGGAIHLVTRSAGTGSFSGALSAGSWGTVRAQATSEGPLGARERAPRVFLAVDGLATEGDALWFDDGGTRGVADDDRVRRRTDNDTVQLSGVGRIRVGDDARGAAVGDAFLVRDEGVPGTTFAPLDGVRYRVQRHLPSLDGHTVAGSTRVHGRLFGIHRDEVLDDPTGALGAPRSVRTLTAAYGARAQVDAAPLRDLGLSAMASVRRDLLDGQGVRVVGRAGTEGAWTAGILGVSATARALGADDELWGLPRAGVRLASGPWAVRAGGGRGVRIPDLTERYGDRGVLVGNPDLRAEQAWTVDASGVWDPTAGAVDGRLEVGGFATDSRDRIVWARNAQGLARPDNVARASLLGLELAGHLDAGPLDLRTAGAWTAATDRRDDPAYAGNQLPGVPELELWHRSGLHGELSGAELTIAHELSYTAGTYDDPTNFYRQAPRALHAATASVGWSSWSLGVDLRNLTDRIVQDVPRDPLVEDGVLVPQAVEDFAGLPLVGRTLMVSLAFDPRAARAAE